MIFQDPYASLDPKMSIEGTLAEPLKIHGIGDGRRNRREQVAALLTQVGLSPDFMSRYPHQFSGGQRQRIAIARALILKPRLVIADEPVSALDVSVQAQVLNLIQDLQQDLGLAILFISHDLNVVSYLCHRVVVLYLGRVMEVAPSRELFAAPKHPYTEALLSAAPGTEAQSQSDRIVLRGELPSPSNPPSGCVFRTRCPYAIPDCARVVPELREVEPGHFKACIRDVL
jgi:oligopeptide/dipeptide ABC transporter ATP-binding protein